MTPHAAAHPDVARLPALAAATLSGIALLAAVGLRSMDQGQEYALSLTWIAYLVAGMWAVGVWVAAITRSTRGVPGRRRLSALSVAALGSVPLLLALAWQVAPLWGSMGAAA